MSVCACVSAPEAIILITSGMILTPYDWLNKFYSCYMASVVGTINESGLGSWKLTQQELASAV